MRQIIVVDSMNEAIKVSVDDQKQLTIECDLVTLTFPHEGLAKLLNFFASL